MTPHQYLVCAIGACVVALILGLLQGRGTPDRGRRWL
jgi:uncharacterized OsmC-like protein